MFLLPAAMLFASAASAQGSQTTKIYAINATYPGMKPAHQAQQRLGKILHRVQDFFAEGSGGRHALVAEVHPATLELPQARPVGKCRPPDKDQLSATLRDHRIALTGYEALLLIVPPSTLGCPGGVQTTFRHREPDGTTRTVPLAISWSLTERYIAHEIVHTHRIGHANALMCGKASLAADCKTREYGNHWDLMGFDGSGFQMISAPLRARMGWTEPVVHVRGQATYTLGAATRAAGLPTALEVVLTIADDGPMELRWPLSLWIEYRAPFGFDQRMTRRSFATGAMVNLTGAWQATVRNRTRQVACPPASPCLLDLHPQTHTFNDAALEVGETWTEPFTGTRITVDARTDTTLTVTVLSPQREP
jgi:hypothetical protein